MGDGMRIYKLRVLATAKYCEMLLSFIGNFKFIAGTLY